MCVLLGLFRSTIGRVQATWHRRDWPFLPTSRTARPCTFLCRDVRLLCLLMGDQELEMNRTPVWGLAARTHPGELPARVGILIVGGGITGVSLLYWLRGRDVLLVERDRLAAGASG